MADTGISRRVILKNVLDPTTWSVIETLRNASIALDADGNVICLPTFNINPQVSPIPAGGSIGNVSIKDASTATLANVAVDPLGNNRLEVRNLGVYRNIASSSLEYAETATAVSVVVLPNTGSTQILAAVAGKQYRIFSAFITGAAVSGTITINEATSGALLLGANAGGASGAEGISMVYGPNGILQPTANNAIQVTTGAASVGYAGVVYGAAR